MIENKVEFLRKFLPESVENIDYTHINLDSTDLSLSDVLRNINKLYPKNSRNRMAIEEGSMVVGVLCRTETLEPFNGVFCIVGSKDLDISIMSSEYLIFYISEEKISSEIELELLMDNITDYLIKNYTKQLKNFKEFYKRFVYNESELYEDEYDSTGY